MDLKSVYNIFLSTDFVKSLSISHQFFTIFSWKDRIMLSVYTQMLDSHVIQLVTRSNDTWTRDTGHFLHMNRERKRVLRSCRVEEKGSGDSRRPSWRARSLTTTL